VTSALSVEALVASERGALADAGVEIRALAVTEVAFDERTVLKCRYSCPAWGKRWTCNAETWGPTQLIPLLGRYSAVLLLTGTDGADVAAAALRVERAAFAAGYPFALAVAATPCSACAECGYPEKECRNKGDLRPESPLAGIDTMATLRGLGIASRGPEGWVRASYVFLA
jgi:predicted metal-binding protein